MGHLLGKIQVKITKRQVQMLSTIIVTMILFDHQMLVNITNFVCLDKTDETKSLNRYEVTYIEKEILKALSKMLSNYIEQNRLVSW